MNIVYSAWLKAYKHGARLIDVFKTPEDAVDELRKMEGGYLLPVNKDHWRIVAAPPLWAGDLHSLYAFIEGANNEDDATYDMFAAIDNEYPNDKITWIFVMENEIKEKE